LIKKKSYSGDSYGTPASCFQYDATSASGASPQGNFIGRLTNAWTAAGSADCVAPPTGSYYTLRSILGYDAMGRIANEQQCKPGNCTSGSGPTLAYSYDAAGNPTGLNNSVGAITISSGQTVSTSATFATTYDSGGHVNLLTSNFTNNGTVSFTPNIYTLRNYGPAGPVNWCFGTGTCDDSSPFDVDLDYTNRLQIDSISATGQIP
jgi:YD repeat-containing protein